MTKTMWRILLYAGLAFAGFLTLVPLVWLVACSLKGAEDFFRHVFFPPIGFCTDNAVMVAGLGYHHLKAGRPASLDVDTHAQVERV